MEIWKERNNMKHFLLDWPIEVCINYKWPIEVCIYYNFESKNLCKLVLNDTILGNVQHLIIFDINIAV